MLNIYLHEDAIGAIGALDLKVEKTPYRSAVIDFVDIPITGHIEAENGILDIKVYMRDEFRTEKEAYREAKLPMGIELDPEKIDKIVMFTILGAKLCFEYLYSVDMLDKALTLNEETEGVEIKLDEGKVSANIVAGFSRPDLLCTGLLGGTEMARPYKDEIAYRQQRDSLPVSEKEALANGGDLEMMDMLSTIYLNGTEGVEASPEKAVYWLRKLAEAGAASGQFNLGLHYAMGMGVERDFEEAARWMEKAAKSGDEDAEYIAQEYKKAAEDEKKAASGDAAAQADLAATLMGICGAFAELGVDVDFSQCYDLAKKSAEQNNGDGIWTLALCYEHARGTNEDIDMAVSLYEKGAALDHSPSLYSLGCYYMRGDAVELDQNKGFELIHKAAVQGYGPAIKTVGDCYNHGVAVPEDNDKAMQWYETFLKDNYDPDLVQKVALMKMLKLQEEDENEGDNIIYN
ncbi:MAG: sel1 repeat family protein [Oscillospiraceae bacterium]|nr:sel1 repeat family protein [Oscillospiraceae bacterium]